MSLGGRLPQTRTSPGTQNNVKFSFSGKLKEELRNSVSAKVVWEGPVEISKTVYYAEVHETLGPSLSKLFHTIQVSLTAR